MSGTLLSSEVRAQLLLQHKKERDGRVKDRIKAVLLRDQDWSLREIAEALFLTEEGVRQHLLDYAASGKLKPENGGSSGFLNEVQTAELLAHLDTHLYVKASEIVAHVHAVYGIRYSVRGMTDWIKSHGFSFHQPCGTPAKADADAQKVFVAKYENIKKNLGDDDQIVFIDGVHPSHAVRFVRGWIRKGVRKEIPTNGSQRRLNILGALNLEKMTLVRQEYDTLNSDSAIAFLTLLLAAQPLGLLHIILDRGRYFYCEAIWAFAAVNPRLCLHYLPPYSPNINAIEPSWKIMHEHTTNNRYHATFKQYTEAIREFFDVTFPQKARDWTDQLTDNFRIIGTPKLA
ncbi:MAG: IS630 family transposase [Alphaproteobacteria bacterium]|nr:IS630 family transposase [Alphaproteobacteria bacterium]